MRNSTLSLLFGFIFPCFAACEAADTGETEKAAEVDSTERKSQGRAEDSEGRKMFGSPPDEPAPRFIGCDDYLTNKSTESYCAEAVPDDWVSFEFEGEQYFVVPLADTINEFSRPNQSLQQTGNDKMLPRKRGRPSAEPRR